MFYTPKNKTYNLLFDYVKHNVTTTNIMNNANE